MSKYTCQHDICYHMGCECTVCSCLVQSTSLCLCADTCIKSPFMVARKYTIPFPDSYAKMCHCTALTIMYVTLKEKQQLLQVSSQWQQPRSPELSEECQQQACCSSSRGTFSRNSILGIFQVTLQSLVAKVPKNVRPFLLRMYVLMSLACTFIQHYPLNCPIPYCSHWYG